MIQNRNTLIFKRPPGLPPYLGNEPESHAGGSVSFW
jgi:hypothetical protein